MHADEDGGIPLQVVAGKLYEEYPGAKHHPEGLDGRHKSAMGHPTVSDLPRKESELEPQPIV